MIYCTSAFSCLFNPDTGEKGTLVTITCGKCGIKSVSVGKSENYLNPEEDVRLALADLALSCPNPKENNAYTLKIDEPEFE